MQLGYGTTYPRVSDENEMGCCEFRGEMALNVQMSDNTSASAVISGVAKQSDILKTAQKSFSPNSAPSNEVSSLRQQLVALSTRKKLKLSVQKFRHVLHMCYLQTKTFALRTTCSSCF